MIKIYLAIPYTGIEEQSFEIANNTTVLFLNQGYNVFSPITHSHSLSRFNLPGDWAFWQKIDYQFLEWADELVVIIPAFKEGLEKVEKSVGVQAEIKYAKELKKPIYFFDQATQKKYTEEQLYTLNYLP